MKSTHDTYKKWNSVAFSSYNTYAIYIYIYIKIYINIYINTHKTTLHTHTYTTVTVFKEHTTFICCLNRPNKYFELRNQRDVSTFAVLNGYNNNNNDNELLIILL